MDIARIGESEVRSRNPKRNFAGYKYIYLSAPQFFSRPERFNTFSVKWLKKLDRYSIGHRFVGRFAGVQMVARIKTRSKG